MSSGSSPAALLRQLGLRPRKRLSQSFLVDSRLSHRIARAADLAERDEVLEIGPGLGVLTCALAQRARRVVAVELDPDLADALPSRVPQNVHVIQGDALQFEPAQHLGPGYKLVANLPYHITSPVLLRYLSHPSPPSCLVVMIQREVAERIAARPGQLSHLGVAVQSMAAVRIVRLVPREAFFPRPKVESAVVRLDLLLDPLLPTAERAAFEKLVQAGFAQPRKQLANSLAQGLGIPKPEAIAVLARAGIRPSRRPQELTLEEWSALFRANLALGGG
ncbi:MAG TPA: 16S rRNA (adenine(1518)-N(6)/adenine(1519)-N(6))-dimethyltransferase RsmA [Chloroflexota bacterium]|nr:16S rRNA (adenine(1518)-N(6)/adenine(1519)-N(6))-dimethyltransferase RsmA [Chloroflexota bacterium]